jgi:hypothetical protein
MAGVLKPSNIMDARRTDPVGNYDLKKICLLHKQNLRYFCDSCEELICYDCTVMGPHNT